MTGEQRKLFLDRETSKFLSRNHEERNEKKRVRMANLRALRATEPADMAAKRQAAARESARDYRAR